MDGAGYADARGQHLARAASVPSVGRVVVYDRFVGPVRSGSTRGWEKDVGMKALVTGGAGFIGHHLVRALIRSGTEVVVVDDLSTGFRWRIADIEPSLTFLNGSILDDAILDRALPGCDVVYHQAAIPSVARSLVDPLRTNEVNVTGTIRLMRAAARHDVARVVYAASSSAYGIPAELPCRESMRPRPESPYGASKLAAEYYVHALGKHAGIATVALRYFNVFGPGQDPTSEYAAVIPRFITALLDGRRPLVNGTGEVSRDFTYIDNVVAANLLAGKPDAPSLLTCNIACGDRTSLLGLLDAIAQTLGVQADPIFGPPRAGDIVHSMADISLARAELRYDPIVPFTEGIRRTVEWYRDRSEATPVVSATSTSVAAAD
jgi:UDP-N-acetylglucosamine/UDP-N-acetyl-alpha-D-glucosaminouronate 4-epimerase